MCTTELIFGQADFVYTNTQACAFQTVTFAATPDSGTSYQWDFDDDGLYEVNVLADNVVNHVFNSASSDTTVRVIINYNSAPSDTVIKSIVINPLPFVDFYVEDVCKPDSTVFWDSSIISSGSIIEYQWDFNNDGSTDTVTSTPASLWFKYGTAGSFIASLTCKSDLGCISTTTKSVKVNYKPSPSYTVQDTSQGDITSFTDGSTIGGGSINTFIWDFGDGSSSVSQNPTHTYDTTGDYTVILTTISDQYCTNSYARPVTIIASTNTGGSSEDGKLDIKSNLLTPNNDGFNDKLEFTKTGCELSIFNRWNDLVITINPYMNDWEGKSLDAGAYYYLIKCDGEEKMGVINVLK